MFCCTFIRFCFCLSFELRASNLELRIWNFKFGSRKNVSICVWNSCARLSRTRIRKANANLRNSMSGKICILKVGRDFRVAVFCRALRVLQTELQNQQTFVEPNANSIKHSRRKLDEVFAVCVARKLQAKFAFCLFLFARWAIARRTRSQELSIIVSIKRATSNSALVSNETICANNWVRFFFSRRAFVPKVVFAALFAFCLTQVCAVSVLRVANNNKATSAVNAANSCSLQAKAAEDRFAANKAKIANSNQLFNCLSATQERHSQAASRRMRAARAAKPSSTRELPQFVARQDKWTLLCACARRHQQTKAQREVRMATFRFQFRGAVQTNDATNRNKTFSKSKSTNKTKLSKTQRNKAKVIAQQKAKPKRKVAKKTNSLKPMQKLKKKRTDLSLRRFSVNTNSLCLSSLRLWRDLCLQNWVRAAICEPRKMTASRQVSK